MEVKPSARTLLDRHGKLPRDPSAEASFNRLQTSVGKAFPNAPQSKAFCPRRFSRNRFLMWAPSRSRIDIG